MVRTRQSKSQVSKKENPVFTVSFTFSLSLSLEGSVLLWSFLRQKTMGGRRRVITSPRSLASPSIKRVNNNTRPVHSYDPSLAFLLSYHDASFFWGKKNLSTEHH